ncbi:unnamed protein product [Cunninghamella blakesleeana]
MSNQQEANAFTNVVHGKQQFTGLKGKHPASTDPDVREVRIEFDKPFPPKFPPTFINLSVVSLDVGDSHDHTNNVRYKTYYKDLDRTGFTLVAETWYTTIVNLIEVEWLAFN